MECLREFYMTYDDMRLRWNGADLLTRVTKKFLGQENVSTKRLELNVQDSFIFFPISSQNIIRYLSEFLTNFYILVHIQVRAFIIQTTFEYKRGNNFNRKDKSKETF